MDNIICENQHLVCEPPVLSIRIGLLSCSEWGENLEMVTLIDTSDKSFHIPIKINDLSQWKEENSIIIGKTLSMKECRIVQEKASLTANIKYFGEEIYIKKIILPYCPNMHILSITLLH